MIYQDKTIEKEQIDRRIRISYRMLNPLEESDFKISGKSLKERLDLINDRFEKGKFRNLIRDIERIEDELSIIYMFPFIFENTKGKRNRNKTDVKTKNYMKVKSKRELSGK
ncbi:hypothetical protein [Leptospira mtsangambouensis]|uniref:hypothetical protein n=1 Tax=Leptospira mtsangambouensis TaxID=2484912 RepID=UPI001EEA1CF2|nr:hypothetical protein [Leptospira mtsangambouensis]MCG6140631.1 hypothetical protein [Leptospira mtsangambouensis]